MVMIISGHAIKCEDVKGLGSNATIMPFCLTGPSLGHCPSPLQVLYKDTSAKGTPVVFTPEMERVKRNQEHISSVYSSQLEC